MNAFDRVIHLEKIGETSFQVQADETWYQGKGVFGGILAAWFVEAYRACTHKTRRPRSMTVQFAAPIASSPVRLDVITEREGTYVSHMSARATQDGNVVGFSTATFGASRDSNIAYREFHAPEMRGGYEESPSIDRHPLMPAFCQHFAYRLSFGEFPYTSSASGALGGYIQMNPDRPLDYASVAALLDAWPPAVVTAFESPTTGAASIDMSIHFYDELPDAATSPIVSMEILSTYAGDGYAEERAHLFTADGRCLAEARQIVAVFG